VGPITASAIIASVGDGRQFRSARHFAAWLGLTPRVHASGGKEHIGRISKGGDPAAGAFPGNAVELRSLMSHPSPASMMILAARRYRLSRCSGSAGLGAAALPFAAFGSGFAWVFALRAMLSS
jgi:transposase